MEAPLRETSWANTETILAMLRQRFEQAVQKGLVRHLEVHKMMRVLSDPSQMMEYLCVCREMERLGAILTSDSTTMQDPVPKKNENFLASEALRPRITAELETAHSSVAVSVEAGGHMSCNMTCIKEILCASQETVETTNSRCVVGWSGNELTGNTQVNKGKSTSGYRGGTPAWEPGSRGDAMATAAMLSKLPRMPVIFACWDGDEWHYTEGEWGASEKATKLGEEMINTSSYPHQPWFWT